MADKNTTTILARTFISHILSTPYLNAFIPLSAALLSAAVFTLAIQLPYRARLLVAPLMIAAAVVSVLTNSNLEPFPKAPEICCQIICFWIHHAVAVLLIEPVYIPDHVPPEQRRLFIRKIWNDPRRLTTWESCAREAGKEKKKSGYGPRVRFLGKAVMRILGYVVLKRCFEVLDRVVGPSGLVAEDFAPERRALVRRLVWRNSLAPITGREMRIRAWMSVEWIWSSYLKISAYNVLGSIVFVAVLGMDSPEEWPSLFGSPLEAYSVQRFWGRFWHQLLRHSCAASGRLISRKLLRIPPRSRCEKIWLAFWTFFVSGVNHAIAAHAMGHGGMLADSIRFRLSNFAAGALEILAGPALDWVLGALQGLPLGGVLASRLARRVFGYLWVFGVFFWIKPQERYAKLYVNLE